MGITSKPGHILAIGVILAAISVSNVTSTPQRQRKGYDNGESRYQHNQLSPSGQGSPVLERSPSRGKVNPVFGDQLQNLDQPSEYETPNYDFKYQIHGGGNYFGHEETRRDYKAQGQYNVLLPDGRRQVVTYYSDQTGYHPTITYELVGGVPSSKDGGYRSKRSRYYKHSKRVHLNHPMSFRQSS